MRKWLTILIGVWLLLSSRILFASANETLPTYHWAYDYIEELQARGYCLDLLQTNIPYTVGQVVHSLKSFKKRIETEKINPKLQSLFQQLNDEFLANPENDSSEINQIQFKAHVRANLNRDKNNDNIDYRGTYRSGIGANIGESLYIFSGVNFDQYDYYDPNYKGYKWRGIAGYTEQAYIATEWKRIQIKLGRDFLKWGAGKSGTLILSNKAQPLDQLYVSGKLGAFRFSFFASELDEFAPVYADSMRFAVKRFLSGHRLDLSLWGGRFQAAVSELLLYGGTAESFKMAYLNPVLFLKGAHKNGASYLGNILPTVDLLIYPTRNLQLYASVLIDDIQLEKTGPVDLEPNEIGWIGGLTWADPLNIYGLTFNAEYVRIANRTYQTADSVETFIHRNRPLGHPLGNDFDHWQFGLSYWLSGYGKLYIS